VPLREIATVELAASLANVTLPVEAAAVVGLNRTLNELDCPAFRVIGRDMPVMSNPEPVTLALVILILLLPELVICTGWVLVTPDTTLPKLTLPGVTLKADAGAVAVLVPEMLTVVTPPWEFTSAMLPVLVPAAEGLNFTVKANVSPGTISTGVAMPLAEKPAPVSLI